VEETGMPVVMLEVMVLQGKMGHQMLHRFLGQLQRKVGVAKEPKRENENESGKVFPLHRRRRSRNGIGFTKTI